MKSSLKRFTLTLVLFLFPLSTTADPVQTYYKQLTFRSEAEKIEAEKQGLKHIESAYSTMPNVSSCRAGILKYEQKRRALNELNAIRRAHNLQEVGYDSSKDRYTSASALIAAANNTLDHYPTNRMKCYSENGYQGSSQGNLHLSSGYIIFAEENMAEASIDGLVIDDNVPSLGHRFWFLDPFLGDISYGRATHIAQNQNYTDGITVYVGNQREAIPNTKADYIAYPFKNYNARWFMHDWYSSFSVIVDKNHKRNNVGTVDYSKAEIRVTNPQGRAMKLSNITYSTLNTRKGYAGLGNSLQWRVIGTKNNERYHVKIKNVLVNGVSQNYEYWFNIRPD